MNKLVFTIQFPTIPYDWKNQMIAIAKRECNAIIDVNTSIINKNTISCNVIKLLK